MFIFDIVVLPQALKLDIFVQFAYSGSMVAVPSCGIQPLSRMMFEFHETCGSDRS